MSFKVGDKVQLVRMLEQNKWAEAFGLYEGCITTVVVSDEYDFAVASLNSYRGKMVYQDNSKMDWALVQDNNELEDLVRMVNEGYQARKTLASKYPRQAEVRFGTSRVWKPIYIGFTCEVRVKEKPKFEPFYVGAHHSVSLDGTTLHVGCQKFPVHFVRAAIQTLNSQGGAYQTGTLIVHATRNGMRTEYGAITWEDADKILAALEKAGV